MTEAMVYTAILEQALKEQQPLPSGPGDAVWTETAEALGDSLYRLCIEFGVPFNTFRSKILSEVPQPESGPDASESLGRLLAETEPHGELVIMALELMREDTDIY
ncbi:MAG: hypothetical protein V3W41_20215 [Planctomycetota bacterium]